MIALGALVVRGLLTLSSQSGCATAWGDEPIVRYQPMDTDACWSADGTELYFVGGRGLRDSEPRPTVLAVRPDGSFLRRIAPAGYQTPRLAPRGEDVLVQLEPSLWGDDKGPCRFLILSPSSGQITPLRIGRREYDTAAPGWRQGSVLFTRRAATRAVRDIYTLAYDGSGRITHEEPLLRDTCNAWHPRVSPDGSLLAYLVSHDRMGYQPRLAPLDDLKAIRPLDLGDVGWVHEFLCWFGDSRRLMVHTSRGPMICDTVTGEAVDYRGLLREAGHLPDEILAQVRNCVPCPDGSDRMVFNVIRKKAEDRVGIYLAVMEFDGSGYKQITDDGPGDIPYVFEDVQKDAAVERRQRE